MSRKISFKSMIAVVLGMAVVQAVAVPQKSWDAIYNAEGEGDYSAAKIEGKIRFGKYTHYKEVQPVSFKVADSLFAFSVAGNMTVPADKIEKEGFYNKCNETMEAWISFFNKPRDFGGEQLVINIAGVDLACGDELFAVGDLRIKFTNPKAQEAWANTLEGREKYKREKVVEYRRAEQEHRASLRDVSGMVKDPRDGQVYRTIKVEGREWFAQNVNYNVEGHSWCYEDKENYCARGGRLYDLEGARKACPEGWHLPSQTEWETLIIAADGNISEYTKYNLAGLALKSAEGWDNAGNDTLAIGFSALPAGFKNYASDVFNGIDSYTYFWTSTGKDTYSAYYVKLSSSNNQALIDSADKSYGFSIRCLKN